MEGRRRRGRGRLLTAVVVLGLAAGAQLAPPTALAAAAPQAAAPDGPGALSHFDLARKDCLGTARNRTSKVWYTVANGVLSDVYYPTVDNTNVETLQYVVTDGATFTDLQTRDTTYTVRPLDPSGMSCRVTTTADNGRYRIVTDYVVDPGRDALLLRVRFEPLVPGDLRLYLRFDPTVNGNGGGGSGNGGADSGTVDTSTGHPVAVAADPVTTTNAANRDYAQPVHVALDASVPFTEVSSGFAGTGSDGLTQLDRDRALTATYTDAANGNLVQTARADLAAGHDLTLALGFGATQREAVGTAGAALRTRVRPRRWSAPRPAGSATTPGWSRRRRASRGWAAPPPASCAASTTSTRTCSRPPRTRPSRGRSWPAWPPHGGRRCRPATPPAPISAPTARCSPATCTRPSPGCCWPATARPHATPCASCSSASSSPTARCRATAWSTASWPPTASASSSTR